LANKPERKHGETEAGVQCGRDASCYYIIILFYRFPGTILDHVSVTNGHWLTVVVEIDGAKLILVCVYGYNSRAINKIFYTDLGERLKQWKMKYSTEQIIVGGDLNVVPDNCGSSSLLRATSPL